ncbi:hypothetical protein GCM10010123_30570 [Pilimelia anulata]|uniref:Protein translocase subunit SecE n=1 Tax=Pilimelia anulata TaxID=53371 RepID=A0A8J3B6X4_9ACTN|nr:preprotein translocase subunit SecE [Pilimelia anulata]GGJ98467.1 hypothetical protein GCM10010123_30570 [Pilimelia anulata]
MAEDKRRGEEPADEQFDDEPETAADPADDNGRVDAVEDDSPVREAKKSSGRVGPIGRLGRFFREIVAELRKVIWPTRKELVTYTAVVIVFLSILTAIVVGLDYGFAKGILALFGSGKK